MQTIEKPRTLMYIKNKTSNNKEEKNNQSANFDSEAWSHGLKNDAKKKL